MISRDSGLAILHHRVRRLDLRAPTPRARSNKSTRSDECSWQGSARPQNHTSNSLLSKGREEADLECRSEYELEEHASRRYLDQRGQQNRQEALGRARHLERQMEPVRLWAVGARRTPRAGVGIGDGLGSRALLFPFPQSRSRNRGSRRAMMKSDGLQSGKSYGSVNVRLHVHIIISSIRYRRSANESKTNPRMEMALALQTSIQRPTKMSKTPGPSEGFGTKDGVYCLECRGA